MMIMNPVLKSMKKKKKRKSVSLTQDTGAWEASHMQIPSVGNTGVPQNTGMIQRHESNPPPPPPVTESGGVSSTQAMLQNAKTITKNPVFLVSVAAITLIGIVYYMNKRSGFLTEKPVNETVEDEETEHRITEEDQQRWRAEQIALEKVKMRDALDNLRGKLGQAHAAIQQNMAEAKNNQSTYGQMFSGNESSSGHDDMLNSMESESNLNTAFMLKEDLEKKKSGMVALGQELGEQHKMLTNEINQIKAAMVAINNEWEAKFPNDQPLFQESQSAPPVPQQEEARSVEHQAAIDEHNRMRNGQESDFIRDGTGREALPT